MWRRIEMSVERAAVGAAPAVSAAVGATVPTSERAEAAEYAGKLRALGIDARIAHEIAEHIHLKPTPPPHAPAKPTPVGPAHADVAVRDRSGLPGAPPKGAYVPTDPHVPCEWALLWPRSAVADGPRRPERGTSAAAAAPRTRPQSANTLSAYARRFSALSLAAPPPAAAPVIDWSVGLAAPRGRQPAKAAARADRHAARGTRAPVYGAWAPSAELAAHGVGPLVLADADRPFGLAAVCTSPYCDRPVGKSAHGVRAMRGR